jgi:hypothetical protein
MNPRDPNPQDFEDLKNISDTPDPLTEQISTPFAAKKAELQQANAAGVEPPRCQTCGELIFNLNPFQVVKYCGKSCRMARNKRGQKQLLTEMRKSGVL